MNTEILLKSARESGVPGLELRVQALLRQGTSHDAILDQIFSEIGQERGLRKDFSNVTDDQLARGLENPIIDRY